jgi:tetratricopeptide (TPR) repeat protein
LELVQERMVGAVEAFGGIVNQVMGDGIMAMFGAPAALEDHALRACHAALQMQSAISGCPETDHTAQFHDLHIRVGINSGELVVAERGDGFNFQYTAYGEAAHVAARMEQLAPPDAILISAGTYALVAGKVITKPQGPILLKGLSRPVEVYQLLALNARLDATASRGNQAPFVGRAGPLTALRAALARAQSGYGTAVAVIGEPGSGKSRLCRELLLGLPADSLVLSASGLSFVRGTPYAGLVACLSSIVGSDQSQNSGELRARISSWLGGHGATAITHLPAILGLFGIAAARDGWLDLSLAERRARILDAVCAILSAESARRSVVVMMEDLQWMDEATGELISALAQRIHSVRILLLVNGRPEYRPDWAKLPSCRVLALENFADDEARLFLDKLLGTDPSLDRLKPLLVQHTDGNAYFLEESIQAMSDAGSLVGTQGHYRAIGTPVLRIPVTVQDVIAMRIDGLSAAAKHLLQAAAVLGTDLEEVQLERLAEMPGGVHAPLAELLAARFLVPSVGSDKILAFRHVLSHDVVYASLLQQTRRRFHARALMVLEQDATSRIVERTELLARHAVRGEVWDKALVYLLAAARVALSRSAAHQSVSFLEEAVSLLPRLPREPEAWRIELELRLELRNALFSVGRRNEILGHLDAAERLARSLKDARGLARALSDRCHCHWLMGQWETAVEAGRQALEIARELDDLGLRVGTSFFMGLAAYAQADYPAAGALFSENITALSGELARERFGMVSLPASVSGSYLALCLGEQGLFEEAGRTAQQAWELADEAGRPFDRVQARLALGGIWLLRGDATEAIPPLECALQMCHAASVPVLMARAVAALGYAYALGGRMEQALELADRCGAEPGEATRATCQRWIAEVLFLAGKHEAARGRAVSLLDHCRASGQRGVEAWTLHLLAVVWMREGALMEAEAGLDAAAALADSRGMRPLLARCRLSAAELRLAKGDHDRGMLEVRAVAELCMRLGMSQWWHRSPLRSRLVNYDAPL